FGLKSKNSDLFDEFKGRGRGREGDLPSDCPVRLWGSKKAPWSDTGKDISGGILIWLKAKYTNSIELVREGENYIWLKLKKIYFFKNLSSNTQNIFLWTIYISPIESPTSTHTDT